jgi:hypothetical protein
MGSNRGRSERHRITKTMRNLKGALPLDRKTAGLYLLAHKCKRFDLSIGAGYMDLAIVCWLVDMELE